MHVRCHILEHLMYPSARTAEGYNQRDLVLIPIVGYMQRQIPELPIMY